MKKAQDFLLDTTLGEKSFKIEENKKPEEKIVLSIEEGAVPLDMLKGARSGARKKNTKSLFQTADEYVRSLGSPTPKDIATFFRLLAIMLNAGVPLVKSLDTIMDQTVNQKLKVGTFDIARNIEKGGTLSESMKRYSNIFGAEQIGMIRSGEAGGQLNKILKDLATGVEKSASIRRKVKGALMYPSFIIVVLGCVLAAMMIFVVPKIAEIFTQSKQDLPTLTKVVIGMSDFLRFKWYFLIAGIVALVVGVSAARRTPQGKFALDWLVLEIPIIGALLQKSILAQFCRSLGNLLSSGVPIIQGLAINADGLGNEIYKRRVKLASEDLARGIPLGESLRDSPEFPNLMVQMIAVGEQTAQLDNISIKVAQYYEEEVDVMVSSLATIIEPVVLVIVGVAVGGIVGAIMMPMMQMTQFAGNS